MEALQFPQFPLYQPGYAHTLIKLRDIEDEQGETKIQTGEKKRLITKKYIVRKTQTEKTNKQEITTHEK